MDDDRKSVTRKRSISSRFGFLIVGAIAIWIAYNLVSSPLLPEGASAPAFSLKTAGERAGELRLEDLRGRVVVLDFWSTTCPPCIRQMKEIEGIRHLLDPRKVAVVGIAVGGETISEIEAFLEAGNIEYINVIGTEAVAGDYKVFTLPTLYVIDAKGNVAASHRGYADRDEVLRLIGNARSK